VADFIGMLYRRNLVKFGPAKDMFDSDIPVVRQFLSGDTEGPIGMSEERDQTKPQLGAEGGQGERQPVPEGDGVRSTSGMTAQETEEAEKAAGAPPEEAGTGPRRKQA
jgi:phospholipid/cholesterol/gamma-HCH transport system ATP-binding protein